jgi:NitT/TauT family transport system permease protein
MGVLILQANFALDLAAVFALLALLGVTGVILSLILRAIETRLCFWSGKAVR